MNSTSLAFFTIPGGVEWILIGGIALLIFGRRLPEVARSVGKSIVEFKRGIKDVKDDVDTHARLAPPSEPKLEHKPAPPKNETAEQFPSADDKHAAPSETDDQQYLRQTPSEE